MLEVKGGEGAYDRAGEGGAQKMSALEMHLKISTDTIYENGSNANNNNGIFCRHKF